MSRLMIMAGGTGGHVIPALAVANELSNRQVEISWIGTRDALEARLVPEAGYIFDPIDIRGLRRSGVVRKLLLPFMLVNAMRQTFGLIRKRKPDAVLGMGGFVSGPGGLMAAILRLPLVLHEQNSVAGLTNKWLARFSGFKLSGFPEAKGIKNVNWTGNPVRSSITRIAKPKNRLANRQGGLRILVVGGSQGASVFNQFLPELLSKTGIDNLDVWHQSGRQGGPEIQQNYDRLSIKSRVEPFIDNMDRAYEWSDVVICRAGAMTVSEICCAGAVALFVPYPYAVNDHQAGNAEFMVHKGAAYMIRQPDFLEGQWLEKLRVLNSDRVMLIDMAIRARSLAKPEASKVVADICMEAMNA